MIGIASFFALGVIVVVFVVLVLLLYYFPLGLWIRTLAAGVPLSIGALIRMRVIGVPAGVIVANLVRARKAGLELDRRSAAVARARRRQRRKRHAGDDRRAARADSARMAARGGDRSGRPQRARSACRRRSTPKVIETPIFQGVAQNGIQLNVKARITVRSNLDRYVGGAGEPTIVARVGEGVVSAVGAAIDHKEVLEYPDRISKAVLAKGLDAGHGVRDRLDRHRRRRRRQEHRRRTADLASRSRPPHRASESRRTAVRGARRASKR